MKTFKIACLALLVAALALGSCQRKAATAEDVIRIGVYEPLTGANAAGGAMELEGIKLANELNPTVEVGGKTYRVELVVADNRSDRAEAANAVRRLIDRDKVHVILGSWGSSMSMAGGEVLRDKIPAIGLSCTNPLVTAGNDWYFRVCFIDPFQGTVMANYAYNTLNARTAVIVQEVNNDYSVALARFFTENFQRLTENPNAVLAVVNYNTGDQDFSAQLTTIRSLRPDAIFAPGNYTESALAMRQARELGITTPFIGGDTWETPEFIDVGGERVTGAAFSSFFAAEYAGTDEAKTFLEEYAQRYPREPAAVTALGYDGYLVALDAIQRAGSLEPGAIRDAIASTSGFVGATGTTTLDQNGDATKSAYIKTVEDGRFVFNLIVEP
ncbi:MAG: ABC transporter substrate-binding protein [Treponema sp.]|jgi:branched-chain amino acid transport system substrate-binding protein|nr:ABC transporter substrate-binding protein [Treponema sp.]